MKMGRPRGDKKQTVGEKYLVADDVATMANKLIDDHHSHLVEARIKYLFRSGDWKAKGKTVLGEAKLISGLNRFLLELDFVIMINLEVWNKANAMQRQATLDKYLTRCSQAEDEQGNVSWYIQDYDVKEYHSIMHRYGAWESDLEKAIKMIGDHKQLVLIHDHNSKTGTEG
jgi:hypothetical protein